jgi:hypothetical protein
LTLTLEGTINGVARLKTVYPTLTEGFYDILLERVKFYKFSDVEFCKAVNHIIDTNKYPPQISDFISYMRPEGIIDIPKREEEEPKGYHDIDFASVPKNEEDLSFLDRYTEEDNKQPKM